MAQPSGDAGVAVLSAFKAALTDLGEPVSSADRVDRIQLLEEIRNVLAAVQAEQTVAFVAEQCADQIARGVPTERVGRGIASQVGLARKMSPHAASRYIGQARILTTELPQCFAMLAAGEVSEWRVLKVAERTAWLSLEHRLAVDTEIAPQLGALGTEAIVNLTNTIGYRLNPRGYLDRLAHAQTERHVSVRPAPDGMAWLSAFLPLPQAVSCYAALKTAADTVAVGPDQVARSHAQVMADTLVQRATGQTTADDVPVAVNLIMTDQTLFNRGHRRDEPAHLIGGGPVPAELARELVRRPSDTAGVFLRKLYRHPSTGHLIAMDSRSRFFPENLRTFLILRDQTCRTPYCNAPIRDADHVIPADAGGPTALHNGQGLCKTCNLAKQAPDWRQHTRPDGIITTTTPTGHQYQSRPPNPPGYQRRPPDRNEALAG